MREVIGFMGHNVLVAEEEGTSYNRVIVEDDGTMRAVSHEEFNKRFTEKKKKKDE